MGVGQHRATVNRAAFDSARDSTIIFHHDVRIKVVHAGRHVDRGSRPLLGKLIGLLIVQCRDKDLIRVA